MTTESKGWTLLIAYGPEGVVGAHVVPIDDLREHVTTPDCWCKPTVDMVPSVDGDTPLHSHNSADLREASEEGSMH